MYSTTTTKKFRKAKEKWWGNFHRLVAKAELEEWKGKHMSEEKLTQHSLTVSLAEIASHMNVTPQSRHRMAKEIAEELLKEKGEFAHFYCTEKLANNTTAPKLWRDVLTYLDEMEKPNGGTVDTNADRPRDESAHHPKDDS